MTVKTGGLIIAIKQENLHTDKFIANLLSRIRTYRILKTKDAPLSDDIPDTLEGDEFRFWSRESVATLDTTGRAQVFVENNLS